MATEKLMLMPSLGAVCVRDSLGLIPQQVYQTLQELHGAVVILQTLIRMRLEAAWESQIPSHTAAHSRRRNTLAEARE
jgi:hypothetical protein